MRPQGKSKQEAVNLFTLDKGKDNAAECMLCKSEHVKSSCHTNTFLSFHIQLTFVAKADSCLAQPDKSLKWCAGISQSP